MHKAQIFLIATTPIHKSTSEWLFYFQTTRDASLPYITSVASIYIPLEELGMRCRGGCRSCRGCSGPSPSNCLRVGDVEGHHEDVLRYWSAQAGSGKGRRPAAAGPRTEGQPGRMTRAAVVGAAEAAGRSSSRRGGWPEQQSPGRLGRMAGAGRERGRPVGQQGLGRGSRARSGRAAGAAPCGAGGAPGAVACGGRGGGVCSSAAQ